MENEENPLLRTLEEQWTCPISRLPISDPVVAADGFTYEREFITDFLKITNNSPLTGQPLKSLNLVPNINLKRLAEKIKVEMPAIISQDIASKTEIQQLKEEIEDLKEELKHQKIRNDELLQKEEAVIKKKIIEKSRHQDKNLQLKMIRDQKNAFQQDLHELRTKEQQQQRQLELLKQELSSLKENYQTVSRKYKENEKNYRNRNQLYSKVQQVFRENFNCIQDILQSIQAQRRQQRQMRAVDNGEMEANGLDSAFGNDSYNTFLDFRLKNIKWLVSKMSQNRPKQYISSFYHWDKIQSKSVQDSFNLGFKLEVHKSRIPFEEYLNFSWSRIRILDLSACNIDDELWQKFVNSPGKFFDLKNLNLQRNIITSVKMEDFLKIGQLLKLNIRHNNLSAVSLQQLQNYSAFHPQIQVDYLAQEVQDLNMNDFIAQYGVEVNDQQGPDQNSR